MTLNDAEYFVYPLVDLKVDDFRTDGWILDIGGGGEGVIGRLKGRDVIAIDLLESELQDAAEGPLKIVMDARDLKFLNDAFSTVTAFFSLMYVKSHEDQQKIFCEAYRVLKPGGRFLVWEVDLSERPATDKKIYVVTLKYRVRGLENETGYGRMWPDEPRGEAYYLDQAEKAGFRLMNMQRSQHILQFEFMKPKTS